MTNDDADPELPRFDARSEAILQEEIELALAPYKDLAPPALLQTMREVLEKGLRTHPAPVALLHRMAGQPLPVQESAAVLKDGAVVDRSGSVRKDSASEDEEARGKGDAS